MAFLSGYSQICQFVLLYCTQADKPCTDHLNVESLNIIKIRINIFLYLLIVVGTNSPLPLMAWRLIYTLGVFIHVTPYMIKYNLQTKSTNLVYYKCQCNINSYYRILKNTDKFLILACSPLAQRFSLLTMVRHLRGPI